MDSKKGKKTAICSAVTLLVGYGPAVGWTNETNITYEDIAANGSAGISYLRGESAVDVIYDEIKQRDVMFMEDGVGIPANSRGAPGVAIFDYDNDGDMDIYVTNGPNKANSLYQNQLSETGAIGFIDKGETAGADATSQDSTGVCYGDIDNDGDTDILVLGNGQGNKLLENNGDGTFSDITEESGIGNSQFHASSCSMGDVNNDGLLDFVVANTFPPENRIPLMSFDHDFLMQHNQLFTNQGDNVFADTSAESGIQNIARITWAIALVDYDHDGDADLIVADDQGPRAPAIYGGQDKGYIRIYNNNGTGSFTDLTHQLGMDQFGAWMGLTFGDLNADGILDMFATNIGDYTSIFTAPFFAFEPAVDEWHSSWFFGDENGGFTRQFVASTLGATPFGWGASMFDYDNDGDNDIIYHGGLDVGFFMDGSNAGALLNNDGDGNFSRDVVALSNSTDHVRRNVRGVAVGDLDNDGFVDMVSVSNQNWPDYAPLVPYPSAPLGSEFDHDVFIWPTFSQVDPLDMSQGFVWNGIEPEDGTLSVELSSADNGYRWASLEVVGAKGLTAKGEVNRDGIGAIVSFTPKDGNVVVKPVLGGASYASQDSLVMTFGLADRKSGTVDILWPGGTKNRLYDVKAGERLSIPEIPCSYEDDGMRVQQYSACVKQALKDFRAKGIVGGKLQGRLMSSAMRAHAEYKRGLK